MKTKTIFNDLIPHLCAVVKYEYKWWRIANKIPSMGDKWHLFKCRYFNRYLKTDWLLDVEMRHYRETYGMAIIICALLAQRADND